MKNLYKLFFCLLFFNVYSQNDLQNANWIFGNKAWLNFNNNTVVAEPQINQITPDYAATEGCASVSDDDGNLLFYTDGERVFRLDANNLPVLVANNLYGDTSSSQNVIIIPRPGFSTRYYIVTITGFSTDTEPRGVFYSEIDVSTWTMVGQINQSLSDGILVLNNLSPNTFNNTSEAITSCIAANGIDFWLILHAKDDNYSKILSYQVTQNGINPIPSGSYVLNNSNSSWSLKVSPDNNRIALGQTNDNPLLGTFNNFNGFININETPVGIIDVNNGTYSVEFSPNSQILYYSVYNGTTINSIFAIDILNNQQVTIATIDNFLFSTIQRAINDRLYVAMRGTSNVLEISNPNDIFDFQTTFFPLQSTCFAGLPQWVWSSCQPTLILSSTVDDVNGFVSQRERSQWIDASNRIFSTANTQAIYHAGEFVVLNPGFEADFGAQFSAYIEGCSNNFVYRPTNETKSKEVVIDNRIMNGKDGLFIYPNPTSHIVELKSALNFKKVMLYSTEGRVVFERDIEKTDAYQIDVSSFANGLYMINVVYENGEMVSQKLIKN